MEPQKQEWTGLHQTLFTERKSNMQKYQEMVVAVGVPAKVIKERQE